MVFRQFLSQMYVAIAHSHTKKHASSFCLTLEIAIRMAHHCHDYSFVTKVFVLVPATIIRIIHGTSPV